MSDARAVFRRINLAVRAGISSAESALTPPDESLDRSAPTAPTAETTAPLPSHWFRSAAVLDVRGLRIAVGARPDAPLLVNGISLAITRGEVVGLVGDAHSGALEVAQCIAGLLPAPAVIRSGSILFNGGELVGLPPRPRDRPRDARIAYLPRDPLGSLDHGVTVGTKLTAPLRYLGLAKTAAYERSLAVLDQAGVERPEHTFTSYPHQLSRVVAQRVHIAASLAGKPDLVVADNPTDTLDESDSADILDLLRALQRDNGLTMIMVTRSISVAALTCHRVAVVQAGSIVEYASVADLFGSPKHPYTRELLHAEQNQWPGCPAR